MDDVNDEQLEIGFVKLQLYDRMINTCGQTITLFADMLTRHSADKIKLNSKDLNVIESIINEVNEIFLLEKDIQLYDSATSTSYEASTYTTRRLSKPYKLSVQIDHNIKGGINFHPNKLPPFEFIRTATSFGITTGIEGSSATVLNNCQDESDKFYKFKADSDSKNTLDNSGSTNMAKGSLLNPYSEYSQTITGTPEITNNNSKASNVIL